MATAKIMPSAEELVQRARDMIPWLRAQAASVEQNRSVPKSTIDAFYKADFFKILQPARWGGYAMNPEVFYRVVIEVARGCPSSGWTLNILGIHQWEFGKFDPKAGDWLWGKDQNILVSSSYAPTGQARRVEGGWMLSGKWPTSSGCEHAFGGAILGARIFNDKGDHLDNYAFLVQYEDYKLIDDWSVIGLCGTASKSLVIEKEAFVPDFRAHSITEYRLNENEWTYQYPFLQIFCGVIAACIIGMAQGMVDLFIEHTRPKQNRSIAGSASQSPFVQEKLGNAVLLIRSARARLLQNMQEMTEYVKRHERVPLELRVQHHLDAEATAKDCFAASHMIFKKTGARGIFLDQPLLRQLRSLIAAANHITQNEDDSSALVGAYLLGQPLPPGVFWPPSASKEEQV